MANKIYKQCEECLKFLGHHCKGKAASKPISRWGTIRENRLTGLNFCSRYEFDETLYEYPHIMESYKTIRVRQLKKQIADETAEHVIIIDEAAGLSSKDFGDLVV